MITARFSCRRLRRGESRACARGTRPGAMILEFAFISIVLVFIILGMIETSRGIMVKQILSNAARTGCRYGSCGKGDNTDIKTAVNKILAEHNLSSADATVSIQVNGADDDVRNADH